IRGQLVTGVQTCALPISSTTKTSPRMLQAAWFWQTAYQQANPPVAGGALPATEPSGVPKGDFAVAHTSAGADSTKMTVLAFDLRSEERRVGTGWSRPRGT